MWEAVRANARRSNLLIALMGAVLLGFGALAGLTAFGPEGALPGAGIAAFLWALLLAVTLLGGERVVLLSARARRVDKADAPRLWNVVEEMTIASGLPRMPAVYVVDEYGQNAFATGRRPEDAAVVVTAGLVRSLNRDELQGVIAHEIGHIRNLDIRFMTIAAVMLGSITLVADLFRRWIWYGGGRRGRFRGGPQIQIAVVALTLLAALLAPLFARLLYLACSRRREYLADASSARFTRYPEGLATALEKISRGAGGTAGEVLRTLAPMYIVNPLQAAIGASPLFSTHPPTAERVRILRSMGGNAGWVDYERAFRQVVGGGAACLDRVVLEGGGSLPARLPTAEPEPPKEGIERAREVADLLDRTANLLLIPCSCGVRIKLRAGSPDESVRCPRCGTVHPVPAAATAGEGRAGRLPDTLQYRRRGTGWEAFRCGCGRIHNLSPGFHLPSMRCKACRRTIEILGP